MTLCKIGLTMHLRHLRHLHLHLLHLHMLLHHLRMHLMHMCQQLRQLLLRDAARSAVSSVQKIRLALTCVVLQRRQAFTRC